MNPNGNSWESNLDGIGGYEYYEALYSGHKWWEEMKIRIKNKLEKQKDLDRRLIEQIGYPESPEFWEEVFRTLFNEYNIKDLEAKNTNLTDKINEIAKENRILTAELINTKTKNQQCINELEKTKNAQIADLNLNIEKSTKEIQNLVRSVRRAPFWVGAVSALDRSPRSPLREAASGTGPPFRGSRRRDWLPCIECLMSRSTYILIARI